MPACHSRRHTRRDVLLGLAACVIALTACTRSPSTRPGVYVALGASDAVGIGAERPSEEGWVPRVRAGLLGHPSLVNLGISGATLDDVITLELPVLEDIRPTFVTIWVGINDLRAGVRLHAFTPQLNELLDRVAATSPMLVGVLNIPDLQQVPYFQGHDPVTFAEEVRVWNDIIAETARRHGARVVDLHGASLDLSTHREYISADGFHPSSAGYERIAMLTLQVMRQP